MYDLQILNDYSVSGSFSCKPDQNLKEVCNAPNDVSGVYVVYSIKNSTEEIIYIGSSGKMKQNGELYTRKGGIRRRIVYGHQFNKQKRFISWRNKMIEDGIDELKVSWWITYDDQNIKHIPKYTEALLLQKFYKDYGRLPLWNKEY